MGTLLALVALTSESSLGRGEVSVGRLSLLWESGLGPRSVAHTCLYMICTHQPVLHPSHTTLLGVVTSLEPLSTLTGLETLSMYS